MTTPRDANSGYDKATLIIAGLILVGFCLFVYFLPAIMLAIGGDNRWISGSMIALVLVLPFAGFWLRGRIKRRSKD